MNETKKILLTGDAGFIGSHISEYLCASGLTPDTLQCDLETNTPVIPHRYDVVIHADITEDERHADTLNNQGTERLLTALEECPPARIILISSVDVYGSDPGMDVREDCFLRPDTPFSRSMIRAEKKAQAWCASHHAGCTILRLAPTFGNGMCGAWAEMADKVCRGKYMHIRGNKAVRSLLCAYDAARAVGLAIELDGTYNVTDGAAHTMIDIADAMAANFATDKRILSLPAGLVKWGLRLVPVGAWRRAYIKYTRSMTFSDKKFIDATGFTPHDTVEVMSRRHPHYPYKEKK